MTIEGDYTMAPDVDATWFIDPPYDNAAGENYRHHKLDRYALAQWCRGRRGQVIVCENEGASWLPFAPLRTFKRGLRAAGGSREVVWTKGCTMFDEDAQ